MITLEHGRTVVYKYGCSEASFHSLGAMSFLFWKTIQEAKTAGASMLDFGRSDADNVGLITFKERWGAVPFPLTYFRRYSTSYRKRPAGFPLRISRRLIDRMPDALFVTAGRLLYRHMG
jgi:hypothetical protein